MGWSGTKTLLWGDAPQDVMDAAVKKYRLDTDTASLARRRQVATRLLADKTLRARVNRTYKEEVGRNMREPEYQNLVKVTTNLGGRTILGPKSMLKTTKKKVVRKRRVHPNY